MYDDCVYVLRTGEGETMAIGTWVDDLVGYASTMRLRRKFIEDISREFKIDDRGDLAWALGMGIERNRANRTVTISCGARVRALAEKYGVDTKSHRRYDTPADATIMELAEGKGLHLDGQEKTRALIGALIYISSTCRPDIAQATYRVATKMGEPNKKTWEACVRILVYLLHTADLGITYGGGAPGTLGLSAMHKPFGPEEAAGALQNSGADGVFR